MARDIEARAVIKDDSSAGLRSFEKNVRDTGKKVEKEYERFGKATGDKFINAVGTVSPRLARTLADSFGNAAQLGAPLLISGISAALPVLSGLVGSAVTGGAAGAGILGGVLIATRDSRVQEAGKQLGRNLLGGLQDRGGVFVQPVLQSIDLLEAKFLESGDTIENIFKNTSSQLLPLVDSVGNAAQSILEGIETASGRAGPVMEALGEGIETVAAQVETFFDQMSSNADANARVLEETFNGIAGAINLVGSALQAVTYVFGEFDKIAPLSLFTSLNALFGETEEEADAAAQAVQRQNDVLQRGGLTVEQAEQDQKAYNKALEDNAKAAQDALNAQQSLFSATTAYGAALDAAKKSAKENGKTLSENTEKGRANRSTLDSLAGAYKRVTAEQIATGASSTQVAAKQSTLRKQFYDVALSMTGSAKKARELTNSLLGIPSPKPKVTLNTANVASQARNARQEIAAIKGKTVTVNVNVNASRLANVEKRLARLQNAGYGASGLSYAPTAPGQSARTGGAAGLTATIENVISLDGVPFRSYTQKAIATRESEQRFRAKVGRRTP